MTLIKSISGIRGTIGGKVGEGLTPNDIVQFVASFGFWLKQKNNQSRKIIIGRDARVSGEIISQIVSGTLRSMGLDVVDVGLSTTPTVEMAVVAENAIGGIILTASHNPMEWNALKLLNEKGEFISSKAISEVLSIADSNAFEYTEINSLGSYVSNNNALNEHIDAILSLPLVDVEAIRSQNFKVLVDAVNSSGGIAVSLLLAQLGVESIELINGEPTGIFAHNPEPLTENLGELQAKMQAGGFDIGIAVDPDVDRLVLMCENGEPFNEEYTLVAVADYVLSKEKGNTVSNLSSTKALKDITEKYGATYTSSAVGEVNVVEQMKATNAIIGGEGNGGIIYPALHYGRDALVGIALLLSHLSTSNITLSALKKSYPVYEMFKHKINLSEEISLETILERIKDKYQDFTLITIDGIKIEMPEAWVHLRKSNTEAIIRIYAEARTYEEAKRIALEVCDLLA
ncbi:phosphoglucosamine mutase [Arcicella rosea]|uniref:Phosphomannomutase n=1 Tax=Arcicella rosea TaxID=502909 RepID=A0A841EPA7_9BACT|nr:phosphoglucosamine mutase [Arcicella rosea]MBB6002558.1 phosphomannomutase [Arcicella rosea]